MAIIIGHLTCSSQMTIIIVHLTCSSQMTHQYAVSKCMHAMSIWYCFLSLKVVTNEKGEAVGEVVTIIC